jgi:hypothetical protein
VPELSGQLGELRFTLEIKRKETGKTETVELVGYIDEAKLKEIQSGSDSQHSSTQRGD